MARKSSSFKSNGRASRFAPSRWRCGLFPVTGDLERTGGVIRISAEAEHLEDALLRARRYLNRNLGLDHKDSFRQLAVLLLAKIYDETRAPADRQFWIKGDEPFEDAGQQAIQQRINECIKGAKTWQPNRSDEYVRWWILRHCEVMASVDLPVEPFKVTVKEYGLTPALPSLLVLRRRSQEELINAEHPEYKVFMAVVGRAGVDARGELLFRRAPDGEELIFDDEVIERVRKGGEVEFRRTTRRSRRIHDELPILAMKFKEFLETGKVVS